MLLRSALAMLLAALPVAASASPELGAQIALVAQRYRDTAPRLAVPACNGLVEAVLADAGLPLRGNVRTLHAEMADRGWLHDAPLPLPGDIVFFDNTYDSNNNGRQDDELSHIAVVVEVDDDGTVHMVHHASKGVRPLTMNLLHPSARRAPDGKVWNSHLGRPGYAREGQVLAGELFHRFASPGAARPIVARVDPPTSPELYRAPMAMPLSVDDEALVRAFGGRALRPRHVEGRSCVDLWFLRNVIVARHGYIFTQPDANAVFEQLVGYTPNPAIGVAEAHDRLTRRDRANLDVILGREEEYCH